MNRYVDGFSQGWKFRCVGVIGTLCGAFCTAFLGISTANATVLNVGSNVFSVGTTSPTGGSVVVTETQPFVTATYSGTLISTVIAGDPSNALGGLDFLYVLHSNNTSPGVIERLTVNEYTGFSVNASYSIPNAGTIAPNTFDRFTADVIGTSFNSLLGGAGPLTPGSNSSIIVLQTNAQSWQASFASVIDGLTTQVNTYSPATVIPEPGTIFLATMAVAVLALARLRAQ